MFREVFLFEIKRALKRPATWFYWLVLFAFAFFLMNIAGGAFKSIHMNISGDNVKVNAPGTLNIIIGIFSYIGIFINVAVVNSIVLKDFKYNTLSIIFTTRIQKSHYIFGRFCAAYFINLLIFTAVGVGLFIGSQMPYLNPDSFGDFMWSAYLNPYLARIIPNTLLVTSLFFVMSLLLRNVLINWLSILALYVLYAVSMGIMSNTDTRTLAALLDPFGIAASVVVTTGRSASGMNNQTISLENVYLYNRILWSSISVLLLIWGYIRFKFLYKLKPLLNRESSGKIKTNIEKTYSNVNAAEKPEFEKDYSFKSIWGMFCHLVFFEFKGLAKNIYFILISIISVIFLFVSSKVIGSIFGTETYPVTYHVIGVLGGSMSVFIYIIIILFSGEMVWRERDVKINEISGSLPAPRWISLGSKIVTLSLAVLFLLTLLIIFGILYQVFDGYFNVKLGQYLTSVYGLQFVKYFLIIVLAFFVQVLVNNKYYSYVIMIAYMVWHSRFAGIVIQHNLFIFSGSPEWLYSDMDGYGFYLWPYWAFKLYWLFFATTLLIFSNLLWNEHKEKSYKKRFKILKNRLNKPSKYGLLISLALFTGMGGYIFYNTNICNDFERNYTQEKRMAEYERLYKKYEKIPQPRITGIKIDGDIYPEEGKFVAKGEYWLKNKTNKTIDSLHISKNEFVKGLDFNVPVKLVYENEKMNYYIYQLNKPMLPNDSIHLVFEFASEPKGFTNGGVSSIANKNGTFIYNTSFPSIGYNSGMEVFSRKIREKHELPEKQISLSRNDEFGINHNFISHCADFVRFEAVLSTSEDQVAMAPGDLIKHWKDDGRSYYHYKMPIPMINYYPVLSAKYSIKEDEWVDLASGKKVALAVYYHPEHKYNLESFLTSAKKSLDYYTQNLSPYQFDHLKIIEFPRYATFAQSFPGMIPFSESIGFVADLRDIKNGKDSTAVDYPFLFTAHEIAHQWWAHQVIAADVEGSQMLMESLTHLCATKILEQHYGKQVTNRFLRDETLNYLNSRKGEPYQERPLSRVAQYQSSLYYRKGVVVMKGLDSYLEKNELIKTMHEFVEKYGFKEAPYPTTLDFIQMLGRKAPDTLMYYINDVLNKITFYDNDVREATYTRNEDLVYFVTAKIEGEKFYADGKGVETKVDMNDWVEVGIYTSDNEELFLDKIKMKGGENNYYFKLDRKPSKIIIDPNYKVIDNDYMRKEFEIRKAKK